VGRPALDRALTVVAGPGGLSIPVSWDAVAGSLIEAVESSTRSDASTGAAVANTLVSSFSSSSLTVITSSVVPPYHIN